MTSLAVTTAFELAWTSTPSLNNAAPFHDTINTEPDPTTLPDIWGSAAYADASENRISMGTTLALYREEGIISIILFARSGSGKSAVMTVSETFRDFFRSYVGLDGNLYINSSNPTRQQLTESVSGDYALFFVDLTYRYDYYK